MFEKLKTALRKEPKAKTAGEQDHSDPWIYAGEDAPAPVDPKEVNK